LVGGEDVEPLVADDRGDAYQRVEDPLKWTPWTMRRALRRFVIAEADA
jgi:hypothetical protein